MHCCAGPALCPALFMNVCRQNQEIQGRVFPPTASFCFSKQKPCGQNQSIVILVRHLVSILNVLFFILICLTFLHQLLLWMTLCAKNSPVSTRWHFNECACGSLKNRRRFLFLRADWFAVISRTLLCFPSSPDSISIQILLKRLSAEPQLWRSPVVSIDGCDCRNLLSLPCVHAHSLEMLLRFDWIVWRRRPTRTHSHTSTTRLSAYSLSAALEQSRGPNCVASANTLGGCWPNPNGPSTRPGCQQAPSAPSASAPAWKGGDIEPDRKPSHYLLPGAATKQGMESTRAVLPPWMALVKCG